MGDNKMCGMCETIIHVQYRIYQKQVITSAASFLIDGGRSPRPIKRRQFT